MQCCIATSMPRVNAYDPVTEPMASVYAGGKFWGESERGIIAEFREKQQRVLHLKSEHHTGLVFEKLESDG